MAVGLGLSFVGYWLAYFGYCSIKGPGVGLIDLIVPGRTITIPSSSGAGGPNLGTPGATLPNQGGGSSVNLWTGPTGSVFTPIPGKPGQFSQNPTPGTTATGGFQA